MISDTYPPDNIATGVPSVPEDEQQEHNNNMIPGMILN